MRRIGISAIITAELASWGFLEISKFVSSDLLGREQPVLLPVFGRLAHEAASDV
jgi:hypothetical protein